MLTRMTVEPGDGLVGRFGDTALLIPAYPSAEDRFVEELIAIVEASAGAVPLPGSVLACRIGQLILRAGSGAVASFGLVSPVEDGALVLLRGAVDASIGGSSEEYLLSGRQASWWVDRVWTAPIDRLALTHSDAQNAQVDPHSDLRGGTVPGAAFVITSGGAEANESPRPTDAGAEVVAERAPEPVPAPGTGARPSMSARDTPRDESRPTGPPRRAASTVATTGAVPELVSSDGSRTPIDREYVVGREPSIDVAVVSGTASSIHVNDPDGLVSRVHARVWTDRGVVFVRDASSANGTFVAAPGAQDWTPVGSDAAEVPLGWSIRVGGQILTLEKATPRSASE